MGCDIHMVLERKVKSENVPEQWATVNSFNVLHDDGLTGGKLTNDYACYQVESRNYEFFGALTGGAVRGSADEDFDLSLRGFPEDASPIAQAMIDEWGMDAHSSSWLYADEFVPLYMKYVMSSDEVAKYVADRIEHNNTPWENILERHFNVGVPEGADPSMYRFVFWFDN